MADGSDLFSLNYKEQDDIMVGVIQCENLDRGEAELIFGYYTEEAKNLPLFSDFILVTRKAVKVTSSAIGVLMKALDLMRKGKSYAILVMTESLLNEIMLKFPEMFDFYAVFHTIEDAVTFIKKRRNNQ